MLDNYLRNRHQFVEFKNKNSDLQEILTGIPQGSILGPLYHSNLPVYFEGYWEHLTKTELEYNLRSRILPVPRIHHVYAESLFVYQLTKILNEFDNSIIIKLKERSHSFPGFSNYVTLKFINNYSDQKIYNIPNCYTCKRN